MTSALRCIFLLLLIAPFFLLHAQFGLFIPIPQDDRMGPSQFVDGKTVVTDIEFGGLDRRDDEWPDLAGENDLYEKSFLDSIYPSEQIRRGEPYSDKKVFEFTKKLKAWLSNKGYPLSTITVLGLPLPESQMRLRFEIERGPRVSKVNISFSGNEQVATADLLESFKKCGDGLWEKYDDRRYNYIAQKCVRSFMYSRGFLRARIIEIKSEVEKGERNVRVVIHEGAPYRVGRIKIEGNHVFSQAEIIEMLGQKPGQIADGARLQTQVYEAMKERYDDLGYIQYSAEFEPTLIDPRKPGLDGTVNLEVTIDEGRRFKMGKVRFLGLSGEEASTLVAGFSLKTGEVFSGKRLKLDIDRLNAMGRFQYIGDANIEFLTDEKASDVDIVVNLRKREP